MIKQKHKQRNISVCICVHEERKQQKHLKYEGKKGKKRCLIDYGLVLSDKS